MFGKYDVEIRKGQIYERRADYSGRISLPSSQFAGEKVQIAVLEKIKEKEE